MNHIVEAKDTTRIYRQGELEVHALRGADLLVEPGEFTALAGPSGSGKTTLLNMIGALDKPTTGTVRVNGQDITGLGRADAARFRLHNIGFIFQAYNLIPVLSAYENAEFILLLQGVAPDVRRKAVIPLMERVGLKDLMQRRPHELSGGQQQRVAIVRALASQPKLILADEPTANLDTATSLSLLDLMLELNKEDGVTFLFSTHDQNVMDRARRIVRLDSGQVVGEEREAA